MCLKTVTKRLKGIGGGSSKPQKWYKVVIKNPIYEGVHFKMYRAAVKNTPIIIGDRYVHKPKEGASIIYGMSKPNPEYDKARKEHNELYKIWEKKYSAAKGNDKVEVWKERPKWIKPKDKTGKLIPMYLPRETYTTGFHFYDLQAAMKMARHLGGGWRGTPPYEIMECAVKRIHTYGEDAHGNARVAYEYEPVKIIK